MKFIYTLIALTLFAVQIHAQQTYTEKLRQNEAGKGTVIINQSPEIEQVVNGKVQQKSETKGRITALPATGDKPVTTGTSLEATRVLISRRRLRWAKNAVLNFQNWLLIPALKHHVGSHTLATLRHAKMPTNMSAKYAAHASLTKYASLQAKWTFPIKLE